MIKLRIYDFYLKIAHFCENYIRILFIVKLKKVSHTKNYRIFCYDSYCYTVVDIRPDPYSRTCTRSVWCPPYSAL